MKKRFSIISVAREVGLEPIVCTHCGHPVKTGRLIVALFEMVVEHMIAGHRVVIENFGSFGVVTRAARKFSSPLYPDIHEIGQTSFISFTQSSGLRPKIRERVDG